MSNPEENNNDFNEEEDHILEEEERALAEREGPDSATAFINTSEGEFIEDDEMGRFEDDKGEEENDDDNDDNDDDDESMGAKEPVEDLSSVTFKEHTDSVLCIALCPLDNDTVATGGCDDKAYLWSASSGQVKHVLKGHSDSVSAVKFSVHDSGKHLATGCMDGSVIVWATDTGKMVQTLDGPTDEIEWVEWHPKGPVIVAGSADCSVWLWNAVSGACLTVFSGHSDAVTCGAIVHDGRAVATGSLDGSVRVWDPKHSSPMAFIRLESSAISLAPAPPVKGAENLGLVGCDDGTAYICNTFTGKVVQKLSAHSGSVEAVGFVTM